MMQWCLGKKLWRKSAHIVDRHLDKVDNPTPTVTETIPNANIDEISSSNNNSEQHSNNSSTQSQISPLTIDYLSGIYASTQKKIEE
jgi:hypothetical protein